MSALAEFIRQKIVGKGWKQGQLARAAHIRQSTLSGILNKETIPRPETLIAIAQALEVEPHILTELAGYPIGPATPPDEHLIQLASQLAVTPWIAERLDDLLGLSPEEFEAVMRYNIYHQRQGEPPDDPT